MMFTVSQFHNKYGGRGYREEPELSGSLGTIFNARRLFAIFALTELLLTLCVSAR